MILEGDSGVIDAIKEKKSLMVSGQAHEHIRPVVVVDGGLMKGAYGAGAGLAFEELGYSNVFTTAIGISSGAPSVAYFLAESVAKGARLLFEECCSKQFANSWRFWNMVDTDYFMRAMTESTDKTLVTEKIFASPTRLLFGVTEFETAKPVLLEPKTDAQLFTAIRASILMTNISSDVVTYEGVRYVDGGFSSPHILQKILTETDATHVLVLTNQDQGDSNIGLQETILNETLFRFRLNSKLRQAMRQRRAQRIKVLNEYLQLQMPLLAVVWGNNSIESLEKKPEKIKNTIEASRLWWRSILK